jgi:hypothetical protein
MGDKQTAVTSTIGNIHGNNDTFFSFAFFGLISAWACGSVLFTYLIFFFLLIKHKFISNQPPKLNKAGHEL